MAFFKLLPSLRTRKILSDEELSAKLSARARNRKETWPSDEDERPVLIRTFATEHKQPPLVHNVDATALAKSSKQAPSSIAIHRAPNSHAKRLREDDGVIPSVTTTNK